uniref:Uncharacterized protein TCIL3000_3_2920 n=1 Tax=Trypanosoma congolense (strain IL3000) TaxID=1068625 RepID=G0UKF3_TRYCI|nr:unnamed protein product [Trypanosoma congolense IL3000]
MAVFNKHFLDGLMAKALAHARLGTTPGIVMGRNNSNLLPEITPNFCITSIFYFTLSSPLLYFFFFCFHSIKPLRHSHSCSLLLIKQPPTGPSTSCDSFPPSSHFYYQPQENWCEHMEEKRYNMKDTIWPFFLLEGDISARGGITLLEALGVAEIDKRIESPSNKIKLHCYLPILKKNEK